MSAEAVCQVRPGGAMERDVIVKGVAPAGKTGGCAGGAMTIRRAGSDDLAILVQLEEESQLRPWPEQLFQGEMENPHSRIDLLLVEGRPAGYLCYHFLLGEISIINLVVSPRFRRRGGARGLLENALLGENGAEKAFLEVRVGNKGAIALYRCCGFQEYGARKGYYADGEAALLMEWSVGKGGDEKTS
ncbi:MAG: GNAT family N-acetyltransferase [Desulfuromonadaceae bacterium]|nr:GNAT family N-acetyltransferase [Desulfuromonadaceae bacterium]